MQPQHRDQLTIRHLVGNSSLIKTKEGSILSETPQNNLRSNGLGFTSQVISGSDIKGMSQKQKQTHILFRTLIYLRNCDCTSHTSKVRPLAQVKFSIRYDHHKSVDNTTSTEIRLNFRCSRFWLCSWFGYWSEQATAMRDFDAFFRQVSKLQ